MKISVITPTYNRKHFLPDALQSVAQSILVPFTDVAFEHLVFDDGSTDGTAELFSGRSWPPVIYLRSGENRGQGVAKNEAARRAAGEYLFFLDSDDVILSRTLFNFARQAKRFPTAGWFVADFLRVDESLRYLPGEDYFGWDFESAPEMLEAIFRGEHFIQNNMFIKKELFFKVGMFEPARRVAEDLDLAIRLLLQVGLPVRGDFVSHLHRVHDQNISQGITLEKHKKDAAALRRKYSAGL